MKILSLKLLIKKKKNKTEEKIVIITISKHKITK